MGLSGHAGLSEEHFAAGFDVDRLTSWDTRTWQVCHVMNKDSTCSFCLGSIYVSDMNWLKLWWSLTEAFNKGGWPAAILGSQNVGVWLSMTVWHDNFLLDSVYPQNPWRIRLVLRKKWCAMDPIQINPSHVSIFLPAPLGSVMGNLITFRWSFWMR